MTRKMLLQLVIILKGAILRIKAQDTKDSLQVFSHERRMHWWRDSRFGMFIDLGSIQNLQECGMEKKLENR